MTELTQPPGALKPPPPPSPQPLSVAEQQLLVSDNQVLVSVFVNALWGVLCVFGFVVLRGWVRGPGGVFQRRQELQDLFMRPPRLALGTIHQIWNWVVPLLAVSDADIVSCSGFDGLILTRVLLLGLQLFTVMTLFGMVVMIPVYYTRGGVAESSASLGTLAQLSVANIPTGSFVYLLPFCMTYVFIGYGCWVLLINCKCYAQLRMAYFTCLDALPSTLQPEVPAATVAPDAGAAASRAASAAAGVGPAVTGAASGDGGGGVQGALSSGFIELQLLGRERDAAAAAAAIVSSAAPPLQAASAGPVPEGVEGSVAKVQAAAVPGMEVRSTWLNMANFFNPTLRMMLDYLDWQNPLLRTAARFGVRGLTLPAVAVDEAPRYARLYGKSEPLLKYDDLMLEELAERFEAAGSAATARVAAAVQPPPLASGEEEAVTAVHGGGGAESCGCRKDPMHGLREAAACDSDGGGGGGGSATVLPYWRPMAALGMLRHAGPLTARGGEAAAAAMGPPPQPLVRSSGSSSTRLRNVATSGLAADAAAAGEAADATTTAAAASGATAGFKGPRAALPHLRYSLRHCNASRPDQAGALTVALASSSYGMSDPRQPLLPGKRNVRLLQILQVPMRTAGGGDAASSSGAAAAGRATVRCARVRTNSGGDDDGKCAATTNGDGAAEGTDGDDPIRLVNARHYVVLIKRVHVKRGPGIIDRMAAATYITVSRLRAAALWAAGASAGAVKPAIGASASVSDLVHSSSAATSSSLPAGDPPLGRRLTGLVTAPAPRDPREVEAQAVAVAAVAVAPLRGAAKVSHDVHRYFEMFEDADARRFDPLSDVCATDTRGGRAGRRRAAAGGGSGDGAAPADVGVGGGSSATAAAVSEVAAGAPDAAAAERRAAAEQWAAVDAVKDPNGAAVAAVLRDLFPKSFQGLIPVTNHDPVDKLIYKWDDKMLKLAAVVRDLESLQARQERRSSGHRYTADIEAATDNEGGGAAADTAAVTMAGGCGGGCCGGGELAAAAEVKRLSSCAAKLRGDVRELERRITAARDVALRTPVRTAYFATFNNSQDAQMLAQSRRVVPPQGPGCLLSFDAVPAPAPDDVSWPGLWSTGSLEQQLRRLAIVVPLAIIFALPIGALQGALSSLDLSLCGGVTNFEGIQINQLYVEWFCKPKNVAIKLWKNLLTGVLPSVLGLIWTALVMPHVLFLCSSISRREVSLSGQERQMQNWFFWYSLINTFLGAVLGGGLLSQLGTYLADPVKLLDKIGRALPTAANFFIQFCIARALFSNCVRLIWPHAGSMLTAIFRSTLRLGRPPSLHAAALAHMPPSSRATSYYNAILQVFMFGCAFAVVAPIILPCCWLFFLTGFFCYRYSILYVYERSYESGGLMWPLLCRQIMGFFLLMEVFSGAVFIVNKAWVLAGVMWTTLTPALMVFWRYCDRHYLEPLTHPPLAVVAAEPRGVQLSPLVYLPPALRPGAIGWYPEQGKVWEKYGIPKHW